MQASRTLGSVTAVSIYNHVFSFTVRFWTGLTIILQHYAHKANKNTSLSTWHSPQEQSKNSPLTSLTSFRNFANNVHLCVEFSSRASPCLVDTLLCAAYFFLFIPLLARDLVVGIFLCVAVILSSLCYALISWSAVTLCFSLYCFLRCTVSGWRELNSPHR